MQAADSPISLRRISDDARRLARIVGPQQRADPSISRPPSHAANIPSTIPHPTSIFSDILNLGYGYDRAADAASRFNRVASTLKAEYEKAMKATLLEWNFEEHFSGEFKAVHSYYAASYADSMRRIRHRILGKAYQHSTTPLRAECVESSVSPAPFKSDTVAILEEAFAESPYPNRAEKTRLAKETGLEYKQVHVWFQNHRNRAKKDGRRIKKDIFVSVGNLTSSSTHIQEFTKVDTASRPPTAHIKFCEVPVAPRVDFAPTKAPAHAFPTPYPPICDYNPFPSSSSVVTHDHWPRHVASVPAHNRVDSVDVDLLARSFADLRIGGHEMSQEHEEPRAVRSTEPIAPAPHTQPVASARRTTAATTSLLSLRSASLDPGDNSPPSHYRNALRFVQQSIVKSSRRAKASSAAIRDSIHPYSHNSRCSSSSSRSVSTSSLDSFLSSSSTASDSPASDSPPATPPLSFINPELPSQCKSP